MSHLPADSALRRAADPDGAAWNQGDHMLAALVEIADAHRLDFIRANSPKNARVGKPIRVPRPGDQTEPKLVLPPAAALASFRSA